MQSKSVLVVEDDSDVRETLAGVLSSEGYAVSSCANGREALDRLRSGTRADVILLDLMMPIMNGWQFRVLQKRDPEIAAIPVLALSADDTPQAAAIDADAYLRKPVDYDRLLGAIERTLLALERRRYQAAIAETERLASLGTLAAGVAHEINNPLAYVAANIDYVGRIVASDAPSPSDLSAARQALAEASDGCRRIRQIVRDVALFSRARDEERRELDVRAVLDSSANMAQHELRGRARVVKDYGEVPPVVANEGRLAQVFVNLILNAAQAMDTRSSSVNEVRLATRADDRWVIVEVTDTGPGIPQEIRGRIFDPFFTTKPIGVGTGLGLSIAHGIVLAHGGEIAVESDVGRGATFTVKLPAARATTCRALAAPDARAARPRRGRVLVIDDEDLIGKTIERILGDAHEVVATTHPAQALERIARGERFDVILCDLMMPEMDGIAAHAAIERTAPEQAARMYFLTGGATNERTQAFLLGQVGRVVEKPFEQDALCALVDLAVTAADQRRVASKPAP